MHGPENTLPMMGGMGPCGPLEMGGGAVGGYLLSRLLGNNNNGKTDNSAELTNIANKLDQTNELLNELLRSHARLEGALSK